MSVTLCNKDCHNPNPVSVSWFTVSPSEACFWSTLVTPTVLKALVGLLNDNLPDKALVISFNGWTGKNFVSKIVSEHIFKKRLESDYVHQIIAIHEFPLQSQVEFYK